MDEEKPFDEKTPEEMSSDDTKDLALSQAGIPEEVELEEGVYDASTNLELKSIAKKIYSALKSQGYKVEINAGNQKTIKSGDFSNLGRTDRTQDKFAIVFVGDEIITGYSNPGIHVVWQNPERMDYNDFVSKLRQSVPELKNTKIKKDGTRIKGAEAILIIPERGSNLSESMLRMQKLAGLITVSDIKKKLSERPSTEELAKEATIIASMLVKAPGLKIFKGDMSTDEEKEAFDAVWQSLDAGLYPLGNVANSKNAPEDVVTFAKTHRLDSKKDPRSFSKDAIFAIPYPKS